MSSLLPQNYLKSTVTIKHNNIQGTGFLLGVKNGETDTEGNNLYRIFLVTNNHVIKGQTSVKVCMNKNDGTSSCDNLDLGLLGVYKNEELDLAIIGINGQDLQNGGYDYIFIEEENIVSSIDEYVSKMEVGRETFLLGFPLDGLINVNSKQIHPVVRQGIIARSDIELLSTGHVYLDINNFPGNSGGPLISKPLPISLMGKDPDHDSKLIGIIKSYIPSYQDYYDQNGNVVMRIPENSGIAIGVPSFVIYDEIKRYFGI